MSIHFQGLIHEAYQSLQSQYQQQNLIKNANPFCSKLSDKTISEYFTKIYLIL